MTLAATGCVGRDRRRGVETIKETLMAKYLVGWLLGVPVVVLVILFFFFH